MDLLNKLSAKEKKWALVTVAVAISAVFYSFLVEPALQSVSHGKHSLKSKEITLKKNLKSLTRYEALRAQYEKTAGSTSALMDREDATELLKNIEKIADECTVSITSLKPQVFEEEDRSKRIQLDISAHADAASFSRFLYRIETSPYLLRVKRFTTSVSSQSEGGLQCELLITRLTTR